MVSNGDVLELLLNSSCDFDFVATRLSERFGEGIGNVKALGRRIERLYKKKPKKSQDHPEFLNWAANSFFTPSSTNQDNEEVDTTDSKSAHRPKKRISDCRDKKTQRQKLQPLIDSVSKFAQDEGLTFKQVVDRLNDEVDENKKKSKNTISIPIEEATPFYFNGGFSSRSWTELRLFLIKFGVEIPPRNKIDIEKKTLSPQIITQEIKSCVTYPDLIHDTVSGLIKISKALSNIEISDSLYLEAKTGIDGSGCHRARHQLVDLDKSADENPHLDATAYKNFLLCCVCPLSLSLVKPGSDKVLLWKNPLPNSINYTRPLCLIRTCEEREVIEKEFNSLFTHIMDDSLQNFNLIEKSLNIPIKIKNTISMIDGKMVSILQGDSGAQCHYCSASREEINNLVCILQGYQINKNYQSCQESWNAIIAGELEWSDPKRAGQCHQPLVEVNMFSILHWKLRSFDFALALLYRLCAGITCWGESDKRQLVFVNVAKEQVQENIRKKVGLLVDVPTSGGGNTNNGPVAERFFSPNNRDVVAELIQNSSDNQNFKKFLRLTNVMLSVCLNTKPKYVNTDKLRQLGIDIMSHVKTSWPWVPINPSLHQMCAHSWQLFQIAHPDPIAVFSEQSQEHWNKHVSRFKSGTGTRARQCSVKANIQDIFTRMLHMSHPLVASKKRIVTCGKCGETGHGAKSRVYHGQASGDQSTNEDELLLRDIYIM